MESYTISTVQLNILLKAADTPHFCYLNSCRKGMLSFSQRKSQPLYGIKRLQRCLYLHRVYSCLTGSREHLRDSFPTSRWRYTNQNQTDCWEGEAGSLELKDSLQRLSHRLKGVIRESFKLNL